MVRLLPSQLLNLALMCAGVTLWAYGANRLGSGNGLHFKPNPLGLKMSAYGQVIGMAMQGPIDLFWHEGESHQHEHDHECADCESGHGHDCDDCPHDHADPIEPSSVAASGRLACPECEGHDNHHAGGCPNMSQPVAVGDPSLRARFKGYLRTLGAGANRRTNPCANSAAHKFYLRRQVENRLRMAYEFDPSNFGTYNAYHLFLSESSLATREHAEQQVTQLSNLTIEYRLRETHDPRPALTAAAAAHDILAVMFVSDAKRPRESYDRTLATLDTAIARHLRLLRERSADGTLELISDFRRAEMQQRLQFLVKLRDADEAAIRRIFGQPSIQQAANNSPDQES